jgi:hypothetical protein
MAAAPGARSASSSARSDLRRKKANPVLPWDPAAHGGESVTGTGGFCGREEGVLVAGAEQDEAGRSGRACHVGESTPV